MTDNNNVWAVLLIFSLSVLFGTTVSCIEAKRLNLRVNMVLKTVILALPFSTVSGRAYYAVFSNTGFDFSTAWTSGWGGRIGLYGAAAGCVAAILIVAIIDKTPFLRLLDAMAPGAAVCIAVIRMTSLFCGSGFGQVIESESLKFFPFGVYAASIKSWLYAVFCYEAVYCLFVFALLILTERRMKRDGDAVCWFALLYGCGRVLFESMRQDSLYIGFVKISQVVSAVLVIFILILFSVRAVKDRGLRFIDFLGWTGSAILTAAAFLAEFYMGSVLAALNTAVMAVSMVLLAFIALGFYKADMLNTASTHYTKSMQNYDLRYRKKI